MPIVQDKDKIKDIVENIELYEKYMVSLARLHRKAYVALTDEGFSAKDAITLMSKTMFIPY